MYSSTLSLTSALGGSGWSTPRPGPFTFAKQTRYPLYRGLGRPQGRFGRMRKISPPPGFETWTALPVANSDLYFREYQLRISVGTSDSCLTCSLLFPVSPAKYPNIALSKL